MLSTICNNIFKSEEEVTISGKGDKELYMLGNGPKFGQ